MAHDLALEGLATRIDEAQSHDPEDPARQQRRFGQLVELAVARCPEVLAHRRWPVSGRVEIVQADEPRLTALGPLERGVDQFPKERMRSVRAALELRVSLGSNPKAVSGSSMNSTSRLSGETPEHESPAASRIGPEPGVHLEAVAVTSVTTRPVRLGHWDPATSVAT